MPYKKTGKIKQSFSSDNRREFILYGLNPQAAIAFDKAIKTWIKEQGIINKTI